jgi:hypothetical protein
MEGLNLAKIYCKHMCKYHNVQLPYGNTNFKINENKKELVFLDKVWYRNL